MAAKNRVGSASVRVHFVTHRKGAPMQRLVARAIGISVLLAIAGLLAACGQATPSGAGSATTLSDAETVWCGNNAYQVGVVGHQLGLALPDTAEVPWLYPDTTKYPVQSLRGSFFNADDAAIWQSVENDMSPKVSSSYASVATAWKTSQSADYLRACRAAFEMR
jgi:hypothetical protein